MTPLYDLEQPVLGEVARFLDTVRSDGMPPTVIQQGERLLLDTAGCMIAGAGASPSTPMIDTFASWAGPPVADVLGTTIRTSPSDAAFVNAYTADVLDFEETLISHPSAVVLAAGLAVAQDVGASGHDLVTAVSAGYEVGSRLGAAMVPSPAKRRESAAEFWWKSVAAAITSGMLLGVEGEHWADVIGYATSASPAARRGGFEFRPLSHLKANYSGQAQVGVHAAYLAARGFRTYRAMLDGHRTFAELLGSDRWDPEVLIDGLGERWYTERIGFKAYPACLYLHALLESIDVARGEQGVRPEDIRSVTAFVPALLRNEMDVRRPRHIIDAQFSAPFAAAALLVDPRPTASWLSDDRLGDPETLAMTDRIQLEERPSYTELHRRDGRVRAGVRIELVSGAVLTADVDTIRGSAARPLSNTELIEKFVSSTTSWLGPARARAAADSLLRSAGAGHVEDLMEAVRRT